MQTLKNLLENNLNQIKGYNSNLVSAVLSHNKAEGVAEFVESKAGDINLLYNNVPIHDIVDPSEEAINLLEGLRRNDPRDVVIIYGLGLGYVLKRFAQSYSGNIIIFDNNLDILRITLEAVDFAQILKRPNILMTHDGRDLIRYIHHFFKRGGNAHFVSLNSYKKLFPEVYKQLENEMSYYTPDPYTDGDIKINFGPGHWKAKDWSTLDCYTFATFQMDLRSFEKLPIDDNKISKAFCSHCIEHIEDGHLENFLSELYRSMKPGGIFRVSCPDAEQALDAYNRGDENWFCWVQKNNIGAMLVNTFLSYEYGKPQTQIDDKTVREKFDSLDTEEFIRWCVSLKDTTRPYIAHTNGYTYEKLSRKLKEAGFVGIKRSGYRQSRDAELRGENFDLHPLISLYVECYKPE